MFWRWVGGFGIVVRDAFDDSRGSNVERGGNGGGAGHIRYRGFAGEETGDGETMPTDTKGGFRSLAVELRSFNTQIRIGGSAVGHGFGSATEVGKIKIMRIIAVENGDIGVHAKERGFGFKITLEVRISEAGRNEIS